MNGGELGCRPHDPQPTNQAHSQVFGEKTPEVRVKLKRICTWIIPVES